MYVDTNKSKGKRGWTYRKEGSTKSMVSQFFNTEEYKKTMKNEAKMEKLLKKYKRKRKSR